MCLLHEPKKSCVGKLVTHLESEDGTMLPKSPFSTLRHIRLNSGAYLLVQVFLFDNTAFSFFLKLHLLRILYSKPFVFMFQVSHENSVSWAF